MFLKTNCSPVQCACVRSSIIFVSPSFLTRSCVFVDVGVQRSSMQHKPYLPLTGPHYIDSHLWLNVSTSFLPVCMCDLPAITAAGGRGGGSRADQDSCGSLFCRQIHSESLWFDFKPAYISCIHLELVSRAVHREQSGLKLTGKKRLYS